MCKIYKNFVITIRYILIFGWSVKFSIILLSLFTLIATFGCTSSIFHKVENKIEVEDYMRVNNASFRLKDDHQLIRLMDGKAVITDTDEPSCLSCIETYEIYNSQIAFGDLNGNGKNEAAAVIENYSGGTGRWRFLVLFKEGHLKKLKGIDSVDLGDRVIVKNIFIKDKTISLHLIVHGPEDAMCCPTKEKIIKYKLDSNLLIEVND